MPRGYGGTAILWRKDIDTIVTPLTIDNNRKQCIEITGDPNLLITSVYLPCKNSVDNQITSVLAIGRYQWSY
jgi:exonuclease III